MNEWISTGIIAFVTVLTLLVIALAFVTLG